MSHDSSLIIREMSYVDESWLVHIQKKYPLQKAAAAYDSWREFARYLIVEYGGTNSERECEALNSKIRSHELKKSVCEVLTLSSLFLSLSLFLSRAFSVSLSLSIYLSLSLSLSLSLYIYIYINICI